MIQAILSPSDSPSIPYHFTNETTTHYELAWPRERNVAMELNLPTFLARGPRGYTQVHVANTGTLWRWGQPWVDPPGQLAVCHPGAESKWISVNVQASQRLDALRLYATVYQHSNLEAVLRYTLAWMNQWYQEQQGNLGLGLLDEDLQEWYADIVQRKQAIETNPQPTFFTLHRVQEEMRSYHTALQRHLLWLQRPPEPEPEVTFDPSLSQELTHGQSTLHV